MKLVNVDASELRHILDGLGKNVNSATQAVLNWRLSWYTNKLAKKLNEAAPSQSRHDYRPVYDTKLNASFYAERTGDVRSVKTSQPIKLAFITLGTGAHFIKPRFKKALWWPGLDHPLSYVPHPGNTRPNNFVEDTIRTNNIDYEADAIANELMELLIMSTTEEFKSSPQATPTGSDWSEGIFE